eukprot:CAMPEP_0172595706 /NCGR_PEP_ID=MMETSP1068-20121228/15337_1 /TAXON_ID=35684 /ORGANISM="Pseudopedinella elastica, Strain CCMP716" /LENGTH=59 /DNA_ID=CAMNT_0013394361 /DNA_START=41 /DNA_END=217 /DNA_ORIENTATION=-
MYAASAASLWAFRSTRWATRSASSVHMAFRSAASASSAAGGATAAVLASAAALASSAAE